MTDPKPTRFQPGSWSGGRLPGYCEHCWITHDTACGLNACLCPCPIPPSAPKETP